MNLPHITVVVPAWNDAPALLLSLRALYAQEYPARRVQLIIVAGGQDNTYATAKRMACESPYATTVLRQQNRGKNAAIAFALTRRSKRAQIIVILDADTIVARDWLRKGLACSPPHASAWNVDYAPSAHTPISAFYTIEKISSRFIDRAYGLNGGSIFLRATLLRKYSIKHLFPETVTVGIDHALERFLRAKGCEIGFAQGAHVKTPLPTTFKTFVAVELRWLRGYARQSPRLLGRALPGAFATLAAVPAMLVAIALGAPLIAGLCSIPLLSAIIKSIAKGVRALRRMPAAVRPADIPAYVCLRMCHRALLVIAAISVWVFKRQPPITFKGAR